MVQRQKRLTKKEKKAMSGGDHDHHHQHIHCIACGRHLDPEGFDATPPTALVITCDHGSQFPACVGCEVEARHRVREHDRSGKPVQTQPAWH